MAHIIIMPRQGNTVESCIITDWKVKEGDCVTPDTTVCEVETDKASFEVPAAAAGIVLKLLYSAGDDVPVLKPIAVIGAAGEDWQAILKDASNLAAQSSVTEINMPEKEAPSQKTCEPDLAALSCKQAPGKVYISPRARNLAEKEALSITALPGSGPGGRIIESDVVAALQKRPPLTAAAKAAAPTVVPGAGCGLGGRVTLQDITCAAPSPVSLQVSASPSLPANEEEIISEMPIKGIRKIISERMHKSLLESAQFTLNASASAVKLQKIRSMIKEQPELAEKLGLSKITVNDLILFAASRTLTRFPYMNAHKTGETIKTFEKVHMAVAVDTPKGLMVPVIRNANLLSVAQISAEAKRLAAACQNGTAKPVELSGSTFTVSNLGSFGVTSFTPVLNTPEVAILGVCGIEMKPVEIPQEEISCCCGCNCNCNDHCRVRFEPHIGFSLTINHQVVDGAPAARFLKALCDATANIDLLLAAG